MIILYLCHMRNVKVAYHRSILGVVFYRSIEKRGLSNAEIQENHAPCLRDAQFHVLQSELQIIL